MRRKEKFLLGKRVRFGAQRWIVSGIGDEYGIGMAIHLEEPAGRYIRPWLRRKEGAA